MMSIAWSHTAINDIEEITKYIALDNPSAAMKLTDQILDTVDTVLLSNPFLGRQGRVSNTRELVVHSSYVVAYTINEQDIQILSVRHTSQLWPEKF